jgi:hypothetical protein
MPFTDVSGIRIVYDDRGEEEPALLFLPGWCVNRTAFADLLSRTSEHRRSLALDWPVMATRMRRHGTSARKSWCKAPRL